LRKRNYFFFSSIICRLEISIKLIALTVSASLFSTALLQSTLQGGQLAANIPGARFVSLPGKNHLPLETDPGMPQLSEEISTFLNEPTD
jgi:hypothetical protein